MFKYIIACSALLLGINLRANNLLIFDTTAAHAMLNWLAEDCPQSSLPELIELPGNQLMQQLMLEKEANAPTFQQALLLYSQAKTLPHPNYLLPEAAAIKDDLSELLAEIRPEDFSQAVRQRVIRYFPTDYPAPSNYPIFFVTTGWQWGDAMTFQYQIENQQYQLTTRGTPGIIFNLTLVAQTYGNDTESRLKTLQDVMAHETFHAVFADYTNSHWDEHNPVTFSDEVLKLILNEGLAHYIANGQEIAAVYRQSENIRTHEKEVFEQLHTNSTIIFAQDKSLEEKRQTALQGTFGTFWEKYLCLSGLFMIYHIEQEAGLQAVIQCVQKGSKYFLQTYHDLSQNDETLPQLPPQIIDLLN